MTTTRDGQGITTAAAAAIAVFAVSGAVGPFGATAGAQEAMTPGSTAAQAESSPDRAGQAPGASDPLSVPEVADLVRQQGYREIREIERDGQHYEVYARDPAGRAVELYVDARTGTIRRDD